MSDKPYDIISISHFFYPRTGGLEKMAYEIAQEFANNDLRTLAVYSSDESHFKKIDKVNCISFKTFSIFDKSYPIWGPKATYKLFNIIRKNKNAAILIHDRHFTSSFLGAAICQILRRKYILVSQTTNSSFFNNKRIEQLAGWVDKYFFQFVVNKAKLIIAVSRSNKKHLENFFKVSPEKIKVIHNSYNSQLLSIKPSTKRQKRVVFASKLIPVKDPSTAIKAITVIAKEFPDWEFYIIGRGRVKDQFLDEINQQKNIKRVKDFLPQDELYALLKDSYIYINSSLQEGLSLSVVDAALLGNKLLLSNAPSNIEVSKMINQEQYIFKRRDSYELEKLLRDSLLHFKENVDMEIVERTKKLFSPSKILAKYTNTIVEFRRAYLSIEQDPTLKVQEYEIIN